MPKTTTPLTKKQILSLTALSFALYFIVNDTTIFPVAIPSIEISFNSDITTTQWLINGYALIFGVLIISCGRIADIFGRRKLFFIGSAIFATFSLICALLSDISSLLVSRALMGVGAAIMWPSILGMIFNVVPRDQSGIAGGLIMTICGVSYAIGPILGGGISDLLGWRWTFLLNPIEAVVACLLCWKFVGVDLVKDVKERIDYAGVITLSISLLCLLLALDRAVDTGFRSPLIITLMTIFLVFLGLFIIVEWRAKENALIPNDIARNNRFFAACLASLMISVAFYVPIFYIPQYFSKVHGYSAILAGMGLLPILIFSSFASYISGFLYQKLKPKMIVSVGAACIFLGMFMLARLHEEMTILDMIFELILLGIGFGAFYSTITTIAITIVDPSRSSLAAGIFYMSQTVGGALGLGINTTIVAMSPDLSSGIARAFTMNAYLALTGFVVCLLFVNARAVKAERKVI
ncbi:DHA2 family efflux MFS transporter permease subunit [Microbulbifer epialgicus]|uniref:DHA2 family efflux MFS transporter permease subunit n=1 Tax=Microbulbifer epialgicus TaxID=393907 RepID=A0ABV4P089_9GAMM